MQSETIGAIAAALAKAQGDIHPAMKDRTAKITQTASYDYATLTSLWESARAALSKNGLAVVQTTDLADNGDVVLITTLMHASGEWIGSVYPVRTKDNAPQTLGSALTYARRYAFGALVGLTSDDDDDGNAAQNGAQAKPQQVQPAAAASNGTTTGKAANGKAAHDSVSAKFHAIGAKLYGHEWEVKRHEIVKATTKGRTESSRELTPDEMAFLVERMDAKLQAQLAEITINGAQEIPA